MSLLIPVISKHRLVDNIFQRVYMCPADKTISTVDLTFFLDVDSKTNQKPNFVNVYVSDLKDLTIPDPKDMVFHRVPLGLPEVTPELAKLTIGKEQSIYIELVGTGPVNLRVSGLEEDNPVITRSGVLSRETTVGDGVYEIYRLDDPLATYFNGTLSVINTSEEADEVLMWVTDNEQVKTITDKEREVDLIQKLLLNPKETVLVENIMLAPNERIYASSKKTETIFSLMGMVVNENGE